MKALTKILFLFISVNCFSQTVSYKEYVNEKFSALEKAVDLAKNSMEKRLEGMNEFRETLKDQTATFMTRKEMEIIFANINADLRTLQESKAKLEGKADQGMVNVSLTFSILGFIIALSSSIFSLLRFKGKQYNG